MAVSPTTTTTPALSTQTLWRALRLLLPVTIVLAAFEVPSILSDVPSEAALYDRAVVVLPMDAPMVVAALVGALLLVRTGGMTRSRLIATYPALVAVGGVLVIAFNPSVRGLANLVRFGAAGLLWLTIAATSRSERIRMVVAPLVAVASVQGLLAVAQLATGEPLGLGRLEPVGTALLHGATVPVGSYSHPYLLAAFGSLAAALAVGASITGTKRGWWTTGAALAIVPVGLVHSRAILIGVGLMLAAFSIVDRGRAGRTVMIVAAVLAVSMLWANEGWINRVEDTTAGDVTTGRVEHARQAVDLIADAPLTGTGPGRYVLELETIEHDVLSSVHNAPLFFAAELGVVLGLAITGSLGVFVVRAVRARSTATGEVVPLALSLLVAITFFAHPIGVLLGGLAGGTIAGDARQPI